MNLLYTTGGIQLVRSPLERLVVTGWPFDGTGGNDSLSTGTTQLVNCFSWNGPQRPTIQVGIEMTQLTATADIDFLYGADPTDQQSFGQAPGDTSAARAGERQNPCQVLGVGQLTASLVNNTGSASTTYQGNLGIIARRLTAVDKLLYQLNGRQGYGWYGLTSAEAAALQALNVVNAQGNVTSGGHDRLSLLVAQGYQPISVDRLLQAQYGGRIFQAPPDFYAPTATSTATSFAYYKAAFKSEAVGQFPVLVGVGIEGAPNSIVTVDRDGQQGYMTLYGKAFAQGDDEDWHCFLPAMDYLNFNVKEGPGSAGVATPVRLTVAMMSMSQILAVLFGRITSRDDSALSSPSIWDLALASAGQQF